jgi:hypothetical protein
MSSIIVSESVIALTVSGAIRETNGSFQDMLNLAGMTKQDLANEIGVWPESISRWGDYPPVYAVAYMELRCENVALRQSQERPDDNAT